MIPTVDDVPKLIYVEKILTESMRLYPPAWALGRQAINDTTIGKYTVRAGSIVLMSQYVMHRNPLYFTDPGHFYPDRWTQNLKDSYQDSVTFLSEVVSGVAWASHLLGWKQSC